MTTPPIRTAVYANTIEEAHEAIRQLGLDLKKTPITTRYTRHGMRGCIIDRLIIVGNAHPDRRAREEMLPAMICRDRLPEVFRWRSEYL